MADGDLLDTLKLDSHALRAVIDILLDEKCADPSLSRRRAERWPLHGRRTIISAHSDQAAAPDLLGAARNISASGASLLLGMPLTVGAKCVISLHNIQNTQIKLHASVVRVDHLQRHLHDIGVTFDTAIDPADFVNMSDLDAPGRRQLNVAQFAGQMLVIEDDPLYRNLLGIYFRNSGLELVFAEDGNTGLAELAKFPKLALIDYRLPGMNGVDLIQRSRAASNAGGLVLMTCDNNPELRKEALKAGANHVMIKPCDPELLYKIAGQYFMRPSEDDAISYEIFSTVDAATFPREAVALYVRELASIADGIAIAMDAQELEPVRDGLRRILETADGYGFWPIALAAKAATKSLDTSGSLEDSCLEILKVIAVSKRAAVKPEPRAQQHTGPRKRKTRAA